MVHSLVAFLLVCFYWIYYCAFNSSLNGATETHASKEVFVLLPEAQSLSIIYYPILCPEVTP